MVLSSATETPSNPSTSSTTSENDSVETAARPMGSANDLQTCENARARAAMKTPESSTVIASAATKAAMTPMEWPMAPLREIRGCAVR